MYYTLWTCVPSNFLANRQVPKFSLNNCAQSSKKTFMCPKFCTNSVLKYTKCHISTNLSNFLKLCSLYCQKLFALAPTNRRFAEKNRLGGNTAMDFFDVYVTTCQYHAFSFCTENVTVLYHTHTPSTVLLILHFGNMPAISSYVHVNPCQLSNGHHQNQTVS